jgi:hypothetical protein
MRQNRSRSGSDQIRYLKSEALIIATTVMAAAAGEAGNPSPRSTDTIVGVTAPGAAEAETALHPTPYKGKLVSALLVGNSQISTGFTPLGTMGKETATPMTVLGDKVGKFMKKRLLHFGFGNFAKSRIKPDLPP